MSIVDFYQKFVSATENNALVESLRRLSLLDDPKSMFEGEPANEWAYWQDAAQSIAVQA
ncbi:MAG: hypothetical protein QOH06_214 [Acidobacteriota bacterium]|jgi:hypothetical protein|nr:hypothetical protein [Acidobacteriota bacterium]